jgi:hypothetical protein
MFSDLLRQDRERSGLTVEQAAWRLGVRVRELEAGERVPAHAATRISGAGPAGFGPASGRRGYLIDPGVPRGIGCSDELGQGIAGSGWQRRC